MPGVNFDRAASFYDATRALPEGVADQVADAILRCVGAGPNTRFLEVGIGTGRIALPLILAGYAYCGIDLSASMLGTLRRKLTGHPERRTRTGLALADAMSLPLRAGAVDVVLMIHLLHLVDDHVCTLHEARRVLRPGGRIIVSANEFAEGNRRDRAAGREATGWRLVTNRWNAVLADLGVDRTTREQGRWLADAAIVEALAKIGASTERVVLARYRERPQTARERVAAHQARIYSSDWGIPDDIHAEASRRLAAWLETEHPAPDAPSGQEAELSVLVGTLTA